MLQRGRMTPHDERALHRLLYRSRSTIAGCDEAVEAEIASLLETSARNNALEGVTGVLLVSAAVFVQALEGPLSGVETVFERICQDRRHFDLEIIDFGVAPTRAFGEWAMRRLHADESIERLLLQLGQAQHIGLGGPDVAARAVELMATLVLVEEVLPAGPLRGQPRREHPASSAAPARPVPPSKRCDWRRSPLD